MEIENTLMDFFCVSEEAYKQRQIEEEKKYNLKLSELKDERQYFINQIIKLIQDNEKLYEELHKHYSRLKNAEKDIINNKRDANKLRILYNTDYIIRDIEKEILNLEIYK